MRVVTRRDMLHAALALGGAALALPRPARAAGEAATRFTVAPLARVIVDNDYAGDPDGLVALAHQLLAPTTTVRVIASSFLNPAFPLPRAEAGGGAAAGRALAVALAGMIRPPVAPVIAAGAERALDAVDVPRASDAARAIVAEALRDDPMPLYLTCGGPLTNVASALLMEPRIAGRMTVIWIGGGAYPEGGWEYNLASDVRAAQVVLNHSAVPLWQVPQPAYRTCQASIAELEETLGAGGALGAWLLHRFTGTRPDWLKLGGTWPLGDSPLVLATALSSESSDFAERPAPLVGDDLRYASGAGARMIRVYSRIDFRLLWGDWLARLRRAAGPAAP